MRAGPTTKTSGPWAKAAIVFVTAIILLALLLAAFPWGWLRGPLASMMSQSLGRPVTIGSMERTDVFSLHPVVRARDIRIAQPLWAGKGDVAVIDDARIAFPVLPLLIGRFMPDRLAIDGMNLDLIRNAAGRESWRRDKPKGDGAGHPSWQQVTISNGRIRYRDAKRDRSFTATVGADATGFRLQGTGRVKSAPVTVALRGPAIASAGRWPFTAQVEGPAVGIRLTGAMEAPLDFGHFRGSATAHATDLRLLDAIIEAGLPATQPVRLAANVRHDGRDWYVSGLKGTVGQSDVAGEASIRKRDGRHIIEGGLRSDRFNFDDVSSDEGRAIAAAKRAKFGLRVIPDTAIDLDNVKRTDGRLTIAIRKLVWPGPSPFIGVRGTLTVDHSRLELPLTLTLRHGVMDGRISIDQRKGGPVLDLRLETRGARLMDFVPDAGIDGNLRGRIALSGTGRTIRAAIGRSSGSIVLVARDGVLPARTASLLGQDLGRGLFGAKDEQASLRCLIARLDTTNGRAVPAPILIDTSRAQTQAKGSIDLATERLDLSLHGDAKNGSALRLKGNVPVGGTIKAPDITPPEDVRSVGGILKIIGRAIADKDPPPSIGDADCDKLTAQAFR